MKNFVAKLFTALEGKSREPSHVLYEDLLLQKKNVSSLRKSVNIDFKHILFLWRYQKKLTLFDLRQFVFEEKLYFRNLRCVNFDGKESCFVSLLMLWRKKMSFPFWRLLPKKREITATGYFRRSLHQWKSPVLLMKKRRISIIGFSVWYFWKTRNEDMSRFRRFLQRKKSYTISLSILWKKSFHFNALPKKIPKKNSKGLKLKRES